MRIQDGFMKTCRYTKAVMSESLKPPERDIPTKLTGLSGSQILEYIKTYFPERLEDFHPNQLGVLAELLNQSAETFTRGSDRFSE